MEQLSATNMKCVFSFQLHIVYFESHSLIILYLTFAYQHSCWNNYLHHLSFQFHLSINNLL